MKRTQGLAAVLAVAALAGGGAVAAASSSDSGTGTTTATTATTATGATTGTTATQEPRHRRGGMGMRGSGLGFGGGAGLGIFDPATTTALQETFKAAEDAKNTATDAGKAPDDIRDAAIAAAKTRLDQAVSDGALTKAQGAAVLAALTRAADARAAVIDAAATVLKLTPTDLAKRLAAGDRLDDIAKAQGVDMADVFSAIQKLQPAAGGASGMLGPIGGSGGGFGFGFGFGGRGPGGGPGFGHRGFGGPGHWPRQAPNPPTQTAPSTQGGSYAPGTPTTTI